MTTEQPQQEELGHIEKNPKEFVSHPLIYPHTVEERLYQTYIAKTALDKNTLVILPTSLGKTVISALVAVDTLLNYRDSRVLIMAPTRPLVMQHKRSFQSLIRLPEEKFVLLTGKTPADYRAGVWSSPQQRLVFATPQVVRNDLREGKLSSLKDFGLVVFDECHRSVKEYAYTEVAETYANSSQFPLILGMTASPGSDIRKIMMVCNSLHIEHVEHRTDEDPDVKPFINPITVEGREVDLPLAYEPVRGILRGMLDRRIGTIKARGYLKKSSAFVSRMDLIDLGSELRYRAEMSIEEERGPLYYAISLQSQALTLFHMIELLDTQGAYTLRCFMQRIEENGEGKKGHSVIIGEEPYASLRTLLDEKRGQCYVEHPKLEELKKIVSTQISSNPKSRLLVFAQYRDTTTHLVEELNKVKGVRAERFVGQASKIRDKGLSQDEQASRIDDFRKGYINTLCSTSIAEEGLDIPEVDLVIFYEPIPSEIRYIQRRGRTGRRSVGRVIILAARNTNDIVYLHASERRTERMRKITETLNQKFLKPVLGLRPRPPLNPMTREELLQLDKLSSSMQGISSREETLEENTYERVKAFGRMVSRAERAIYMRILESGMVGLDEDTLYAELLERDEGFQASVVKAALHRLVKRNYLSSSGGDDSKGDKIGRRTRDYEQDQKTGKKGQQRVVTLSTTKEISGSKLMEVEIEKVMQGQAVVLVDQRWHARLHASDYVGPRQLIKKRSKFRALCELYHTNDVLCVKVRKVIQTL